MNTKAVEVMEIDTKEICLLCYDPCVTRDGEESIKRASSLTGLKQLLRYLKVDPKQLFNCSPGLLQWMEIKHEIDVQITLCANCSLVTQEFDKLYREYELIQFQFDKCLASLHQSMKSGADNPERVREFKKQMQPNKSIDIVNASMAVNLRDQTYKKCSLRLERLLPRVTVQKVTPDEGAYLIKKSPINFDKPWTNHPTNSDKLEPVSAMVPKIHVVSTNNNQDIQDCESPYDPSLEEAEHDPLEPDITDTDNIFDDEDTNDAPPIHFSSSNSPASETTFTSSNQPIPNTTNRSLAPAKRSQTCNICNKYLVHSHLVRRHQIMCHPEHLIYNHYSSFTTLSLLDCKQLAAKFFEHAITKRKRDTRGVCCCYCGKSVSTTSNLKCHLMNHHMAMIDVTQLKSKLVTPLTSTEEIKDERCDQCSKVFATKAQLRKHKRSHSKAYSCHYCSYTHGHPVVVKTHELCSHIVELVTPHMAPITCPIKISEGVKRYRKNLLKMAPQCPTCRLQLAEHQSLQRHIMGQHFEDFLKQLKDCLEPTQVTDDGGNEVEENADECSSESFVCQFCSFSSEDASAVSLHELELHTVELVMQHLPPDTSRFECAQGVKAYRKNLAMMGTRCPKCVSAFETNAELQRHILSRHFDEWVKELEDYLEGCRSGGSDDAEGQSPVGVITPTNKRYVELEMEVKMEVDVVTDVV